MAQHDMDISNQAFTATRSDINAALLALASNSSGATAPATTYAYQWWADTTTGILKQRNAANNAWVNVLNMATGVPLGAAASGANSDITSLTGLIAGGLPDNSVLTADIAALQVTGAKIAAATITADKLSGAQSGSAPIYGCRAWCVFNGTTAGTNAPISGGNVTNVTRNGTGDYTVNFTTAMPDANYAIVAMGRPLIGAYGQSWSTNIKQATTPTTSACQIVNSYQDDNANTVFYSDADLMCLVIFC